MKELFFKYRFLIVLLVLQMTTAPLKAQVDMSIVVTFDQAPTAATAIKAPLKYNKDFALSMQIDDGHESIFTAAFPVFMGGQYGSQTFPGLTYTDGCGNEINFKMSTAQFSFNGNGENGPDTHVPGSGYGMVSWPQMDTLYKNGWGIINHGVNGDASTDPNFMEYSLNRNKSYTRRNLMNTTEGGVLTRAVVNPNGQIPWSQASFDLGYFCALNQDNNSSFMGDHGGNVNSPDIDWKEPQNLYRLHNNDINVTSFVGDLADSSATAGNNYWGSMFTHSIGGEYPFTAFYSDYSIIASNYGTAGADNILMAPDEEIINYLLARDSLNISSTLAGSSLFISLSGDLPDDMRYYAMTLVINADANITNVNVIGADSVNHSAYGTHEGLINVFWDGEVIIPSQVLADSMTTIAANSQLQRDAWVAMDYVITMENNAHKDSLREVLCAIPGTIYDEGFCSCLIDLGPDTTICEGECDSIFGPDGFDTYQWMVADTVYDTTQNIYVCPEDTTQYVLNAENEFCLATDTIIYNVNPSPIFDLGNDTTMCFGDSLTIYGPDTTGLNYTFEWIVADTIFDTTQNITVSPADTTQYFLNVENSGGCVGTDSIWVFVLPAPTASIFPADTTSSCFHDSTVFTVEGTGIESYLWNTGDTTQSIKVSPPTADTIYKYFIDVTNNYGCGTSDTAWLNVNPLPETTMSYDTLRVCDGSEAKLSLFVDKPNLVKYFIWHHNGTSDTASNIYTFIPTDSVWVYLEIITIDTCEVWDSSFVALLDKPNLNISNDQLICPGDTATLTISGADYYYWTMGQDTISTDTVLKVFPGDTTKYFVEGGIIDGCSANDSVTVFVLPKPEIDILYGGSSDTVCQHSLITLTASGGSDYWWNTDETTEEIQFVIETDTTIILYGNNNYGCIGSDTLLLHSKDADIVSMSGLLPAYCENDPASILVGEPSGGLFTGSGIVGGEFRPFVAGNGPHTIKYTFTNTEGCTGIDSASTVVYGSGEEIDLGPNQSIGPSETIQLDAGDGFDNYYWSTGSTYRNIIIHYGDNPPGSVIRYVVMGVINGCTSQGETFITFIDPDGVGENSKSKFLIYPNPNNGSFTVSYVEEVPEFTVSIYNYFGKLILTEEVKCGSTCKSSLDLRHLSKGMYIIKTMSVKGISSGKLLVN